MKSVTEDSYRTTIEEFNYYASDFNKFIATHTDVFKTVNNADAIVFKIVNNKHYKYYFESKHKAELIAPSQLELLLSMQEEFDSADKSRFLSKVFVIKGNAPYDVPCMIYKYPFGKDDYESFSQRQLILLLNWKIDYNKNEINWDTF